MTVLWCQRCSTPTTDEDGVVLCSSCRSEEGCPGCRHLDGCLRALHHARRRAEIMQVRLAAALVLSGLLAGLFVGLLSIR